MVSKITFIQHFKDVFIICIYVCMPTTVYLYHMHAETHGDQKCAFDPPELVLQANMIQHMRSGNQTVFSIRAVKLLNHLSRHSIYIIFVLVFLIFFRATVLWITVMIPILLLMQLNAWKSHNSTQCNCWVTMCLCYWCSIIQCKTAPLTLFRFFVGGVFVFSDFPGKILSLCNSGTGVLGNVLW